MINKFTMDNSGNIFYFKPGTHILHREGGPAVENYNGSKEYWVNGKLHREDGPAVENYNGSKEYWVNGKLHRADGPALEYSSGYKAWLINDEYHRIDGPAIESTDGEEFWYYGNYIEASSIKDFIRKIKLINFL